MRLYMLFVSDYLGGSLNLLLRQQVQLVQVRLDVAVGDLLTLLDAQDLAHGGIRVDGVALLSILQLVGLNVGTEGTSDISGRLLAAIRQAKEGAQGILQGDRGGEDGGALLLGGAIRGILGGTTTATTSLLEFLGNLLLQLLQGLDGASGLVTKVLMQRNKLLELILN